jgi:hypothetical protein
MKWNLTQTSSLVYSFRQVNGLYLGWNTVALAEAFVEYLTGFKQVGSDINLLVFWILLCGCFYETKYFCQYSDVGKLVYE